MQSKAASVEQYLADLPEDRRTALSAVREVILRNLDTDYAEGMTYGMIGYFVPHSVYPPGYPCNPAQPLPFAALASQKNYMSLYLMSAYCACGTDGEENTDANWFRQEWAKTGKRMDMGKSCIRFKKLEDLPLPLIGKAIKRVPARKFIAYMEAAQARGAKKREAAGRKSR